MDIPLPTPLKQLPEEPAVASTDHGNDEYSPSHITSPTSDDEGTVLSKMVQKKLLLPPPPPPPPPPAPIVKIDMTKTKPLLGAKRMNSLFKSFKSAKTATPSTVSQDLKPARGNVFKQLKNFNDDEDDEMHETEKSSSSTAAHFPRISKHPKALRKGPINNEENSTKSKTATEIPHTRLPSEEVIAAIANISNVRSGAVARFDNMGFFVDPTAKSAIEKERLKKETPESGRKRSRKSISRSPSPVRKRSRSKSPSYFRGQKVRSPTRKRHRSRDRSPTRQKSDGKSGSDAPININNQHTQVSNEDVKHSSRWEAQSRSPSPSKNIPSLQLKSLPKSWKECKNKGIDICHPGFPEAKRRLLGKNYVEYEKKTFLVKRCQSPKSCFDDYSYESCKAFHERFMGQEFDVLKESPDYLYKEFPLADVKETTTKPVIKWSINPEASRLYSKRSELFPKGFPNDIVRMLSSNSYHPDSSSLDDNASVFCHGCTEKDFLSPNFIPRSKRTLKSVMESAIHSSTKKINLERESENERDISVPQQKEHRETGTNRGSTSSSLIPIKVKKTRSESPSNIREQSILTSDKPEQPRIVRIGNMVQIIPSAEDPPKIIVPSTPPLPQPVPEPKIEKIERISPVPPPIVQKKNSFDNEFLIRLEELKLKLEEEHQQKKKKKISQRLQGEKNCTENPKETKVYEKAFDFLSPEMNDSLNEDSELTHKISESNDTSSPKDFEPTVQLDVQAMNMSDKEWRVRDSVRYISLKPFSKKERKRQQRMMNQADENDSDEFTPRSPVPLPEPGKSILCSIHLTPKSSKKSVWYADGVVPGQGSPDNRDTGPVLTPKKQIKPKRHKKIFLKIIEDLDNSGSDVEHPEPPPGSPPRYHSQHLIDKYGKQSQVLVKLLNGTLSSRKGKL